MKRRMCLAGALVALLWATPARADNRIILRTSLSLQALNTACNPLLLAPICTVVGGLGDPQGQVYLITSPLDVSGLLNLLGNPLGIIDAELEQLLNLVGGLNILPTPIPATVMSNRTLVPYPAGSTTSAWDGYVNQPAASIVGVQDTQKTFNVLGTGIVADIDTGVDPTHPALQGVLLPGYDFTRNQSGGSELNDTSPCPFASCPPPPCPTCSPAKVNQSTAAVLDQSTAAVLDGSPYAAFGHGTMVMGIIHLVAPTAQLLPLKAFHSDGTASLSHELRHHDGVGGTAESPRLRQPAGPYQRGVGGKRRDGGNCISRGVANRCDGRGVNDQSGRALVVLELWEHDRMGGGSWRSDCEYLPVQHVCGGMGDVVQRTVRIRWGGVAAQRKCRH